MAGTNNSWNNQIAGAYNNIVLNAGTNDINIGTDTTTSNINIGTDTGDKTIHIGFGVANKSILIGVANGTTSVDIESGSGGATVNSIGGTVTLAGSTGITVNSGSGTIGIGDQADPNPINIGTGASSRVIVLGNTTGTTSVSVQSGSGSVIINTGLTIDSSGRNFNTKQPAFKAIRTTSLTNATGAGTGVDPIPYDTTVFDQTTSFDGNYFTAPITGVYHFVYELYLGNLAVANNFAFAQLQVAGTSAAAYQVDVMNPYTNGYDGGGLYVRTYSVIAFMTAGDTAHTQVRVFGGAGDTVSILGLNDTGGNPTSFSGYLTC